MYNKFLSAISYKPSAIVEVANEKVLKESCQSFHSPSNLLANHLPAGFHAYETEDDFHPGSVPTFRWPMLSTLHPLRLMPANRALGK